MKKEGRRREGEEGDMEKGKVEWKRKLRTKAIVERRKGMRWRREMNGKREGEMQEEAMRRGSDNHPDSQISLHIRFSS